MAISKPITAGHKRFLVPFPNPATTANEVSLDFVANPTLSSPFLFSRSSTATYLNSSGVITTASTTTPRFDYTTAGVCRGLLIEGAATNRLYYSQDLSQSTVWDSTELTFSSATSPANTSAVCKATVNTPGTKFPRLRQADPGSSSQTAGSKWTFSCFVKYGAITSGTPKTEIIIKNETSGGFVKSSISWTSGGVGTATVTSSSDGASFSASAEFIAYPNGWYRVAVAMTQGASGWIRGYAGFAESEGWAGGDYMYFWGAQLESGIGATSYIPTTSNSSVQRGSDVITSTSSSAASRGFEFSLDDLLSGSSSSSAWAAMIAYERNPNSKREYPASIYGRSDSNVERLDFRDFSGSTIELGTQTRTIYSASSVTSTIVKAILTGDGSAQPSVAFNGTLTAPTTGTIDPLLGLKWLQWGNSSIIAGSFNPIWVRQFRFWKERLTNSALQSLTA